MYNHSLPKIQCSPNAIMKIIHVTMLLSLALLAGCDEKKEVKAKVDAECYFSSTKSTAYHFTDGSATKLELDGDGNQMSGWAWVKRVTDSISDATCHEVNPD
ncbi:MULTISPECIES: hypothetical protein [Citrobacter]|uniref:hypothetical protein n=1 Tax=Citrobacter TaxID=544 RepID=UPI00214D84EC|nr:MULTISPECIES: hypothetical protein [Citrobacter]EKT9263599.1 hypothetical protein [Citrobacter freundii]EKU4728214.1 hypothetical protein [Citrobacter freundii]EKV2291017.1 hypothetical protein [Citrobacter freundii]EKW0767748.1 hypothetical protein [Citrobacter freundii]MCR3679834.1 hypothetical protein [Citrobacter freundii]